MKKMSLKEYYNKVNGCWIGKNIGGTLGAPFECYRGCIDIDFYTQELKDGALPNDDLDLQLVWLNAVEKYGRQVDAKILGEYWLTNIVAHWSEYGACKSNMMKGFAPAVSGLLNNHNKDSNGAWIRSEIWACLAPGHPEIAAKYAYEDAIVDHADEGVYSELFFAAIQSAAFSEQDRDTLIQIGLSFVPKGCAVERAVNLAIHCYNEKINWKEARKKLLQTFPSSFGDYHGYKFSEPETDIPSGTLGYDAPANVAITILAWLYGENDFGKCLCIAAGCMEDGDCTAGTLGSILGIIMGADALPKKWTDPIGDKIKTISIDLTGLLRVPQTTTELTDRVCRMMPQFLERHFDLLAKDGAAIHMKEGKDLFYRVYKDFFYGSTVFTLSGKLRAAPAHIHTESINFGSFLECIDGVCIKEGEPVHLKLTLENRIRRQQWMNIRIIMPEQWRASCGKEFTVFLDQYGGGHGITSFTFSIDPVIVEKSDYTVILDIRPEGRFTSSFVPIRLISAPEQSDAFLV